MQSYNDDRDKMPMEDLFKGGKPADMDWFYLENRIRTFIHDLVTPYARRTIDAKDQLSDIKDMIIADRKNIDDLKMQVLRLKKYDEFFGECNKKLLANDQLLKNIEKKFKDEIGQVNGQKTLLKEKIYQMESEVNTFKNQVIERNIEIKFLFEEITKTKETLHQDLILMNRQLNEDMIVQQERIQEIGEKVYSSVSYNNTKFKEFNKFDVKIALNEMSIKTATDQITEINSKISEFNRYCTATDKHLQKFLPLQISSFLYDALSQNIKAKFRPKLRENFNQIFQMFEQNTKMEPQFTGDFNFKKLEYSLPNTLNRLSLNMSKNFNMSMSSGRGGLGDSESPKNSKKKKENDNQKIFVLHHRKKNPFRNGSVLNTKGEGENPGNILLNDEKQISSFHNDITNVASPPQGNKFEEMSNKGGKYSKVSQNVNSKRSRKVSKNAQPRLGRKKQSADDRSHQQSSNLHQRDINQTNEHNSRSGSSKIQLRSNQNILGNTGSVIGSSKRNEQSNHTIADFSQNQQSHKSSKRTILRDNDMHINTKTHHATNFNNDYEENDNKIKTPAHSSGKHQIYNKYAASRDRRNTKKITDNSILGSRKDRSNRDLDVGQVKKTFIVINNPNELRKKVEQAVAIHFENEVSKSKELAQGVLSRVNSIKHQSEDKQNSSDKKALGQVPSQKSTNFGVGSNNNIQSPIEEVAQSQEISSPIKPQDLSKQVKRNTFDLYGAAQKLKDNNQNKYQFPTDVVSIENQVLTGDGKSQNSQNQSVLEKQSVVVDKLVSKIQESYKEGPIERVKTMIKIPQDETSLATASLGQGRSHAISNASKTGKNTQYRQNDNLIMTNSIKAFDLERQTDRTEEDKMIEYGKHEITPQQYSRKDDEDFLQYGDEYDPESDGAEFVLEQVDPNNLRDIKNAKRQIKKQTKTRQAVDGIDEDGNETSEYDSQEESSPDDEYSRNSSRDSYFSQMIFSLQQDIDLLRSDLFDTKAQLAQSITDSAIVTETKATQALKKFSDSMYEVRLQLLDESSRLKRERTDLQLEIKKLRDTVGTYANSIDGHNQAIARVQIWAKKVGDIMQLSSIIEAQEERDKQSIALIGLKESVNPNNDQTFQSHKKNAANQVVQLDNKCLTCNNNTSDRAILYSQFKMACLQYRPSNMSYKNQDFTKDEILNQKSKMILDLQNIELYRDMITPNNRNTHQHDANTSMAFDDQKSMFINISSNSPTHPQTSSLMRRNLLNKTTLLPLSQPASPTSISKHPNYKLGNSANTSNNFPDRFKNKAGTLLNTSTIDQNPRENALTNFTSSLIGDQTTNYHNSALSQYKAKKMTGVRPFSVAETFRIDEGINFGMSQVTPNGLMNDEFGNNGNVKQITILNKAGINRGHLNTRGSALPSTTRGGGAFSGGAKVKLELSIADRDTSIHNLSVITATNSVDNNQNTFPNKQQKYIGLSKHKQNHQSKIQ
eukprot:403351970